MVSQNKPGEKGGGGILKHPPPIKFNLKPKKIYPVYPSTNPLRETDRILNWKGTQLPLYAL